ncbi:ABC transporter substrate-binding protein [Rhodococcus sp. JVH1]|uniref:ABC transporter substrate-binding protein n=1 Tax=Rhodococcus sp. JVH1 TaxID=745408 RepID=UPI0005C137FB|nr:ABC transporter substrate-binding protein [Rhodococcus sp. JVH1]
MAANRAHGRNATALVSRSGVVRDRPRGALAQHSRLIDYLRVGVRFGHEVPFGFLWLAPGDRNAASRNAVLRVRVLPTGTPETCEVDVTETDQTDLSGLTRRELQVLTLMVCGLTNSAIADCLSVERRTAASHVESLFSKLCLPNRAAAAAVAADQELIALPLVGDVRAIPPVGALRLERWLRSGANETTLSTRPPRTRSPLTLGAIYPRDTSSAADGAQMTKGTRLAVEEINERGGVAGRRIEVLPLHVDATDGRSVRSAIEGLIDSNVDALTLGYTYDRTIAGLAAQFDSASSAECPLLHHSTSANATRLTLEDPERYGNVFQVCAAEDMYGIGFVRAITDLRDSGVWVPASSRILVLESQDPDMVTLRPGALVAADRAGWQLDVEHIDSVKSDWPVAVREIVVRDPAAVMVTNFSAPQVAAFVKLIRSELPGPLIYTLYAPSVPGFLEQAGEAAEGLLWATVTGLYGDRFGRQFGERFHRRFGERPGLSSAGIHYDMVHLLALAWSRCASPRDFREVNARLREAVHRGVNGAYYLGNRGQTNVSYLDAASDVSVAQAHLVFQVQDGQHRIIAPTPLSESMFRE